MHRLILAAVITVLLSSMSAVCYAQEPTASGDLEQMRNSIKQLTAENEHLRALCTSHAGLLLVKL